MADNATAPAQMAVKDAHCAAAGTAAKVVYLGIFLTPESRERLLALAPPAFARVYADHLTLAFRPTAEEVAAAPLGQTVTLELVGHVQGQGVHVAVVDYPLKQQVAHITIATAEGVPPKQSNALLAERPSLEAFTPFLRLEGVVDTFPRRHL